MSQHIHAEDLLGSCSQKIGAVQSLNKYRRIPCTLPQLFVKHASNLLCPKFCTVGTEPMCTLAAQGGHVQLVSNRHLQCGCKQPDQVAGVTPRSLALEFVSKRTSPIFGATAKSPLIFSPCPGDNTCTIARLLCACYRLCWGSCWLLG